MDIIKFKSGEMPVTFPFDAMVELMGDDGIASYLDKYMSLKSQIHVLKVGLKYGIIKTGKPFTKTDNEIKELAKTNPRQLKEVFKIYDQELATFLRVYYSEEQDEDQQELTEEEKIELEKAVKN